MAGERATAFDVARLAGVSQSAVSRYFTPGTSVSSRTAQKIHIAAQQLGYRPNVLARSLTTGRSRIIGLVVAYLENQFYPQAIERLSRALQREGYHVLVFISPLATDNVDQIAQEILDYQVDGIVLASVSLSSRLADRCQAAGVPIVLFNRSQDDPRLSSITTDNEGGGRLVADFLVDAGHERFGYIAGIEETSTQRDREAGFRAGLAARGRSIFARASGNFQQRDAHAATLRMFGSSIRPDAVFVCNDHMAFAVMDVLRFELALRVPEDVAVIGFDDTPPASWPAYGLSTVHQDLDAMVAEAVAALLDGIGKPNAALRRLVLPAQLILRRSTRPLA